MKVLGVTGKKGHGKDSLVNALAAHSPLPARRLAFADPIKEMLHVGLDIPREILWGPAEVKERVDPRFGKTYRHMAQTLGTEWGRDTIHPDIWIKLAFETHVPRVEEHLGPQLWLLSDVRFLNEAHLVRLHGGKIIRIVRPGYEGTEEGSQHASETEMAQILPDVTVINGGTLEDLGEMADEFLSEWL